MSIKYKKSDGSIITIPTGGSSECSEWFGTKAELEEQFDSIPNGTKINILDDDDGNTIQKEIDAINNNLTAAINDTNTAVNELNNNLTNINVYVGEDKKLHFVDSTGADSVVPFSSGITPIKDTRTFNWSSSSGPNAWHHHASGSVTFNFPNKFLGIEQITTTEGGSWGTNCNPTTQKVSCIGFGMAANPDGTGDVSGSCTVIAWGY